ncbi:MAG: hypothetical protein P8176_07080 [Gammaproteobacteria bacterium]
MKAAEEALGDEHIPVFLANPALLPKELSPFKSMGGLLKLSTEAR